MKNGKTFAAIAALIVSALVFAPAVMAEEAQQDQQPRLGLYGGISGGLANHDDTDQAAWSLHTWFRPFTWGAIQMGYSDLGDDVNGFHALAMPMIPLPAGFTLTGNVGVFIQTADNSDRDDMLTYGGGFMYDIPEDAIGIDNFLVRFDYERYEDGGDSINNFLVGFAYRFGILGG
jgi:hypothetical protein